MVMALLRSRMLPHLGLLLGCMVLAPVAANTILDDTGRSLPQYPIAQRVVTLSPHATELLLAAGGQALLVGAARYSVKLPTHIPVISTLGGVDREQLLQLQPDLVIAWASGNRASDLFWLQQQGIRVFRSEPQNLPQIATSIRSIGQLIGHTQQASQAADSFLYALQQACPTTAKRAVYVSVWDKPAMSIGGRHWLNDVLHHAGLHNTYQALTQGIFSVEAESLASQQDLPSIKLDSLPDHQLSRPGPQLLDAVRNLCHWSKQATGTRLPKHNDVVRHDP